MEKDAGKVKVRANLTEKNGHSGIINKADMLDKVIESCEQNLTGSMLRSSVQQIFDIDLNKISERGDGRIQPSYPPYIIEGVSSDPAADKRIMKMKKADVMDAFIRTKGGKTSGSEIRQVINDIFGINLNGISALDHLKISLYSKGQWILKKETDLFVIYTGKGDIDVSIYPAPYFIEKTGYSQLPDDLQDKLIRLGYSYNDKMAAFYYLNPDGETVSDNFKKQTITAVVSSVQHYL
ncbi:hypothetical protein GCM10007968_32190 [Sporolactobacillus putidus]|uniref:Uncharacterized protein n=1 Tax=Sporolactobacillus putidus TaxID=492735 RepID=A0A917SBV8_9BACL|nr:hypothetical protein GCM10007968_32190 [Sporolactobacillus putidus]